MDAVRPEMNQLATQTRILANRHACADHPGLSVRDHIRGGYSLRSPCFVCARQTIGAEKAVKVIAVVLNLLRTCALVAGRGPSRDLSSANQFGPLVDASAHRIEIARQVALAKWDSHRAVEDERREKEVISSAVEQGVAQGVDREFVSQFVQAQIDANKFVQYALLSEWRRRERAPQHLPFDLSRTIRPELDAIQSRLIDELVLTRSLRRSQSCGPDLNTAIISYLTQHRNLTPVEVAALRRSLAPVCH
jgi:chorismate mutase